MTEREFEILAGRVLEAEAEELGLAELCRCCGVHAERVIEYVEYGILEPRGSAPPWRFPAAALPRLQRALRLERDLGLNTAGVALALDLLEEIDRLQARLRALGWGP